MDILRKLQSILAPPTGPESRSRIGQIRPEVVAPFPFDRTLGDVIQMDPFRHLKPVEIEAVASGPIPVLPPDAAGLPTVPEALIDASHASTLAATIAAASRATAMATIQPSLEPAEPISPASEAPATLGALPVASLDESSGPWAPVTLRGSGAPQGIGIDGSDAGSNRLLALKFSYYSDPKSFGMTLNQEGRLFRDAVDRGYVPNTAEGLGTVLSYLSMGSFAHASGPGRPPAMTQYFNSFYQADVQAYG